MKTSRLLGATALASAAFLIPHVALAQTADTTTPDAAAQVDETSPTAGETIVVTGSRIRRPNVEGNVPVTAISSEELFQQGQTNLGDTLNDLPQLRSTFAQQNPGAGVGITGLNLLDLRGLGTVRTLVLVNGRRHVPADILNNASSPDVNTISNDLIERVEVVTGGSSAVYGSDAIAGVVNFILRRDFDGIQVRGSAGVSGEGYGPNQYISAMVGKNFGGGRGNITLQAEYANQERVYASDIKAFRRVDGFATVDVDVGGLPQGSDAYPDAMFFRDIRSATNSRFGLAIVPQNAVGGVCGTGTAANNGGPNNLGTPYNCNFLFDAAGNVAAQTGTRFGSGPAGTYVGGNGVTGREGTLLSILPSNQRINLNMLAHFEVSEALEFFFEGKYARTEAVGNQLGPTFLNNSTGSLGNDVRLNPRLDNPFLNPAARATIANAYTAANCGFTLGQSPTAATCVRGDAAAQAARAAAIANGSYRFMFARTLADAPDRDEYFTRDTYRFVGGIRGGFNEDWNYELSANYGKFKETADMRGFVDRQRFLLSLDAGLNPLTGTIQCRSQFVAAAATGAPGLSGDAASASKLASDIAACVPYNPFGAGAGNQAAVDYFKASIINRASIEQFDVTGFVGGDLSQLFSLPGGPIRFVIGGEYRSEKAFNNSDEDAETGLTNSVFLGDVDAKAVKVKEAFGELEFPLLRDVPFFEELTVNLAGRVSDYNTAVGTTYSYNAGLQWAPIPDIRFRAQYGRAVRAPNVSEAGFPAVDNFANNFQDPCSVTYIASGTQARVDNCNAQLTAAQRSNLPLGGYSLGIVSGSNADLQEEKSDSYTYGAVIQPRFFPGFSLSVDYYNITVNNVIVSLAAQTIVNACYDTPNLESPLCSTFSRNLGTSNGPNGETPGQILFYSLTSGPQNFARRVRKGIDVQADYRHTFSDTVQFDTRLIYTHGFKNSNYENPTLPDTENILLNELGDPKDEFRFNANLSVDRVTFGYEMRYIGPMLTTTFENFFANNSGIPGQTGLPLNSDAFEIKSYPAVLYHDVRLDFQIGERGASNLMNFYVGVDNVMNKQPPLGTTATGAGSAIYNIRGRNFFAGFRAKF
jgi:outer membrane receptor protein involved in Fe transport